MFNSMLPVQDMTVVPIPIDAAYRAAVYAANECGKIKTEDALLHRITFTTGASFTSWGELLTVQLAESMGNTQIFVSSQLKTSIGSRAYSTKLFAEKNNKKEIDNYMQALSRAIRSLQRGQI